MFRPISLKLSLLKITIISFSVVLPGCSHVCIGVGTQSLCHNLVCILAHLARQI